MAIEKDKQKVINLFIFLLSILKKIIIPPNKVDIPASVDIKKAFNVFKNNHLIKLMIIYDN